MTLMVKAIAGSVAVSTVGLGVFSIFSSITPKTLGQELESLNFTLVTEDSTWDRLVKKYKDTSKDTPKKISSWSIPSENSNTENDRKSLKEKCLSLWNTEINSDLQDKDQKIEDIKNWCVTKAIALNKDNG